MSTDVMVHATVSEGRITLDFGERLIITGPGPDTKPRRGQPFLSLALEGPDKFKWEEKLADAKLGDDLTRLVKQLANVPGAELIDVYPGWIGLQASVMAKAGEPALNAVEAIYGVKPAVTWLGGRPLYPEFVPPYQHMGL